MAINKKLIHFKNFSDFNSKKLSANESNTQYTLGIDGAVTDGSPDILYQSICWIKDTKQQWTHGQLYNCSGGDSSVGSEYAGNYPMQSFNPTLLRGSRIEAQPNTYYVGKNAVGEYGLTITLATPTNNSIVNEYVVEFSWGSIQSLSLPSTVKWANDDTLVPEYGHTYVLSIVNNIATYIDINEMLHPEYEGRPDN